MSEATEEAGTDAELGNSGISEMVPMEISETGGSEVDRETSSEVETVVSPEQAQSENASKKQSAARGNGRRFFI